MGDIVKKFQFSGTETEQLVQVAQLWIDSCTLCRSAQSHCRRLQIRYKNRRCRLYFSASRRGKELGSSFGILSVGGAN